MQEMRLTNARLREQLAQKEEQHAKDAHANSLKSGEMSNRIQELLLNQTKFDSILAEKQARLDELLRDSGDAERRSVEQLSAQTLKSSQAIRAKDLELEDRAKALAQINSRVDHVSSQLLLQKENTNTQISGLNAEKSRLQEALDHSRGQFRTKQEQFEKLQQSLAKIQAEKQDEANQVGTFVSKSLAAIKLVSETSDKQNNKGTLVVKATSNLGFSDMTIETTINAQARQ